MGLPVDNFKDIIFTSVPYFFQIKYYVLTKVMFQSKIMLYKTQPFWNSFHNLKPKSKKKVNLEGGKFVIIKCRNSVLDMQL